MKTEQPEDRRDLAPPEIRPPDNAGAEAPDRLARLLQQRAARKAELQQLEAGLPAHSVRPWQLIAVEEAEEALEEIENQMRLLKGAL